MTYQIQGLDPQAYAHLFTLSAPELEKRRARRVIADSNDGYPCRVSLQDAKAGEALVLVNHLSLDSETPFRARYGIYVREAAVEPPLFVDALPDMLDRRTLSLRAFDAEGMLRGARLAGPGAGDAAVRELLADQTVREVHAHNAAYGCFLAKIERH